MVSENGGKVRMAGRPEPVSAKGLWPERTEENRRVVTALNALLGSCSLEEMLKFLHRLHIRFSLTQEGRSYRMRIFRHETDAAGCVECILDYQATGESPMAAIRNGMAEFLVHADGDYHEFLRRPEE